MVDFIKAMLSEVTSCVKNAEMHVQQEVESVRKSVSVHSDKIRGLAILDLSHTRARINVRSGDR